MTSVVNNTINFHLALIGQEPYLTIVNMLLKEIDFNAKNAEGNTAMHLAVIHKADCSRISQLLAGFQALGGDLNQKNKKGNTPLHLAVSAGNIKMTRILHELGADLNLKNKKGNTPLHLAASAGDINMTMILHELGADLNMVNKEGKTPLTLAMEKCTEEELQSLTICQRSDDFAKAASEN